MKLTALCVLTFVLVSFRFIPEAGVEDNEALVASGLYSHDGFAQNVDIFRHRIPVMLMSYVGALKSWAYAPIFTLWRPSAISLRVPAVLVGGFTIWLFSRLLQRLAGSRA